MVAEWSQTLISQIQVENTVKVYIAFLYLRVSYKLHIDMDLKPEDKQSRRRSQVTEQEQHTSQKSQPAPQPTPDDPPETVA